MNIITATREHATSISKLMLADLHSPPAQFPPKMIAQFREHAKEENILKEFANPAFLSFVATEHGSITAFIAGYTRDATSAVIHYISNTTNDIKKALLNEFINKCKARKINKLITDAFAFMDNNAFYIASGFKPTKKEQIADNLEMI